MYVYRIEDPEGRGPYNSRILCTDSWMWEEHDESNGRPAPRDDGIACFHLKEYLCGFCNITQLKNWFTKGERMGLKRLGYRTRRYSISHSKVIFGKKQVVFLREDINK